MGTPEYMSPEQIKGSYGSEADIWSAGVIIYLAMCGVPPFWASSRDSVKELIAKKEVSFRFRGWASISSDCKDCIAKMLTKDPFKRATSVEILGEGGREGGREEEGVKATFANLIIEPDTYILLSFLFLQGIHG